MTSCHGFARVPGLVIITSAAWLSATSVGANPPGYDSSWTSKETAEAAIAAEWDYNPCVYQHLRNYAKKTQEPAATIVTATLAACYSERVKLLSTMRKAQPKWQLDWLDRLNKEMEPERLSIVLDARSE
jgi:hypothetical protein